MKKNAAVHVPKGFLFAAGEAGLRSHAKGLDVALIYSEVPAQVGALFTTNRVKAAPVVVSQQHLKESRGTAQAIVVNAGNANCATGAHSMNVAAQCALAAADLLAIPTQHVLLASTGVIGVPMPPRAIPEALPKLVARLDPGEYSAVSRAIMTTDTRPKVVSRRISLLGRTVNILGMAKGAGMINPRMATMLAFIFTDAAVGPRFLRDAVPQLGERSFNRISVDGDTSTNDTVYIVANGMAGNPVIKGNEPEAERLREALTGVAQQLAIAVVKDGEGAKKLVEIRVEKAAGEAEAATIARSIALSSLVKTAITGADPNWGRILSAAGNSGVAFDPAQVDIFLNKVLVCRKGGAAQYDEPALKRQLAGNEVLIRIVLRQGNAKAAFWTCDLTEEYIRINASYRT